MIKRTKINFLYEVDLQDWLDSLNPCFPWIDEKYREGLTTLFEAIFYKNLERKFRDYYGIKNEFEDRVTFMFQPVIANFVKINAKKFIYLLDTINEEFLSTESVSESEQTGIGYNIDYYGGEGQRDKSTVGNRSTNVYKDNKNKLWNFSDLMDNRLIKDLLNIIFATYYINEEETW